MRLAQWRVELRKPGRLVEQSERLVDYLSQIEREHQSRVSQLEQRLRAEEQLRARGQQEYRSQVSELEKRLRAVEHLRAEGQREHQSQLSQMEQRLGSEEQRSAEGLQDCRSQIAELEKQLRAEEQQAHEHQSQASRLEQRFGGVEQLRAEGQHEHQWHIVEPEQRPLLEEQLRTQGLEEQLRVQVLQQFQQVVTQVVTQLQQVSAQTQHHSSLEVLQERVRRQADQPQAQPARLQISSPRAVVDDAGGATDDDDVDKRCYLPETLFQAPIGYVKAGELKVGDVVKGADGSDLEVKSAQTHKKKNTRLVELKTEWTAPLVVTAEHRIVIADSEDVLARDLGPGDTVLCTTAGPVALTQVRSWSEPVEVVELRFHPDEPIAVHRAPEVMVLTKGQSKRRTRRGGKGHRSVMDVPDTECEYSD